MIGNLFLWNVRGINETDKHSKFRRWIYNHHISVGALLETHLKEPSMIPVINALCPGWNFYSNHQSDHDGRIVLIWKPSINVTLLHQSRQSMTCRVDSPPDAPFFFTAIYAGNTAEERTELWVELLNLQNSLLLDSSPWLVVGDFNEITHPAEHSASTVTSFTPHMVEFNTCLSQLEIRDLRFHGPRFMWSNKCPENPIAKKLDRALINEHWLDLYPNSLAKFLPPEFSDHSPCCIILDSPLPLAGTKPFKIFNYLTSHPDFLSLVAESWTCTETEIHTLALLSAKQKDLKRELKRLNKENFSEIQRRVIETNSLFTHAQVLSLQQPTCPNFAAEKELRDKLNMLRRVEEEYFKQLSRINWLKW